MNRNSLILTCVSVVMAVALLTGCAGMQAKPTEKNFQAPVISLEQMEVAHAFGYWYFAKSVKPTKGNPDDVKEAVSKLLDSIEDKSRVIVSCGGGMPPGVSSENIRSFIDTVKSY